MGRDYYTVMEVAKMAGTYRLKIIRAIRKGELDAEKIGRDWLITKVSADRWLKNFKAS